ncbi:MAG: 50S ribosomal protein L29 [Patescibacteria group bacterium]
MKKTESQQFKNRSFQDLQKDLIDYRSKLQKLKFDLVQGKVKNIKEIKETRRMIARILTIINRQQTINNK